MVKKRKQRSRERKREVGDVLLIPTGITLLNCALSGRWDGGYRAGTIFNKIGDSTVGKTIEALTCFAEVARDPRFDKYDLILDEAEYGEAFDKEKLFGKKLIRRLKAPAYKGEEPLFSDTIQDFHMYIKDAIEKPYPFIYILDSFDSVDAQEDQKYIEQVRKAWKKGTKKEGGTYGAAKAKQASTILRNIRADIHRTKSLIIIISQTRDNMNAMSFGSKKTRSGGKALKFYSWQEQWMYLGKKITSGVNKKIQIGINTITKLGKNRETGKLRTITYPIYNDLGIDDVGANIAYLIEQKWIKKRKNTLVVPELDFEGTRTNFIEYIEENNLEKELQKMVGICWNEYEETLKLNRKPRY